jgi:Voltage-dependent anion channel
VWLLPIVASEVAAASGGLVAPHLAAPEAFLVLILSYVLWACSVPLAMSVLVLLFLRLALHKLPERDMGVSAWLALGPIGTGALGLVVLGGAAAPIFAANGLASVGEVAFGLGAIGGLMLWGYGVWWLSLAILKTVRYLRGGLPFNLGWWGFTFPLAVYTLAALALARVMGLGLFSFVGAGLALCLAIFWVIVASRTLRGAWTTTLFIAPCLNAASAPVRFEADVARGSASAPQAGGALGVALDLSSVEIGGAMRLGGERKRGLQRFEVGRATGLPTAGALVGVAMRRRDLEIEQADRRGCEAERRHRREPRRLHDAAKGHPDRSLQLIQRCDRVVIFEGGKLHDENLSARAGMAPTVDPEVDKRRSRRKRLRSFRNWNNCKPGRGSLGSSDPTRATYRNSMVG